MGGYLAFAGGIRIHAWTMLVKSGVSIGYHKLNAIKKAVASRWNPAAFLDPRAFLTVSFDNLNWLLKFASKLFTGGSQAARALGVLTAQMNWAPVDGSNEEDPYPGKERLFGIPINDDGSPCADNDITADILRQSPKDDVLDYFHLPEQDTAYSRFEQATFSIANSLAMSDDTGYLDGQKMVDIVKGKLPQKNPPTGHRTVFVSVEEACSGTLGDVSDYIMNLKAKLKVGERGGPPRLVLAGDQQVMNVNFIIIHILQRGIMSLNQSSKAG